MVPLASHLGEAGEFDAPVTEHRANETRRRSGGGGAAATRTGPGARRERRLTELAPAPIRSAGIIDAPVIGGKVPRRGSPGRGDGFLHRGVADGYARAVADLVPDGLSSPASAPLERRRRGGVELVREIRNRGGRVMSGVDVERGAVLAQVAGVLSRRARFAGLTPSGGEPIVIESEKGDTGAEWCLHRRGAAEWSLSTAALVVRVGAPAGADNAQLRRYAQHDVEEVVIVDHERRTIEWLALNGGGAYSPVTRSKLINCDPAELGKKIEWPCKIDREVQPKPGATADDPVAKALDLLIDGELKLLALYDARQASADTRTAALATAAIGLPTLILTISGSFASHAVLLHVGFIVIAAVAAFVVFARSWNAWRRRANDPKHLHLHISAEAAAVAQARRQWRGYQDDTPVDAGDPIRVRQLALKMWRARAMDSRRVAEIKDVLSVIAAVAFAIGLAVSVYLVWHARFTGKSG